MGGQLCRGRGAVSFQNLPQGIPGAPPRHPAGGKSSVQRCSAQATLNFVWNATVEGFITGGERGSLQALVLKSTQDGHTWQLPCEGAFRPINGVSTRRWWLARCSWTRRGMAAADENHAHQRAWACFAGRWCSSLGRALEWHSRGKGFSRQLQLAHRFYRALVGVQDVSAIHQ